MEFMQPVLTRLRALTSSRYIRVSIGILLSGISLYLALRKVEYHDVWQTLTDANMLFIGLALASVAINTLSKAIRWKILIGTPGQPLPFSKILAVLLVGQMLNTLVPLRVGDVSRAYVVGGMGPGRVFVLGTIVLEKMLDMISYALLFSLALVVLPLPTWMSDSVLTVSLIAAGLCIGIIVLVRTQRRVLHVLERMVRWLPAHMHEQTTTRLHAALSSLDILRSRTDLVWLIVWSAVIWGTAILNNYLTLLALHIVVPTPVIASLIVVIILQIGISLPSAPGTIGVFQYGCIVALGLFGVGETTGLSYGIVLHAIVMAPTTLIGALLFWTMGLGKK